MRVIAGEHKGRRIQAVPGKETRPTTDKVKESLFNRMGPYFEGGQALDLFAGSGNLGIEALSRGMDHVIFVDQQKQAIQTIHNNLEMLQLTPCAEVYRNDAFRALKAIKKRGLTFDYIFLDPPYYKGFYQKLLKQIADLDIAHEETLLILEHDTDLTFPDVISGFEKERSENYGGTTAITLYKRKDGTDD
ncbi:16S rRNA (guanine(966)-N(2))-methyltransferase RsmD [Halolactibacillus halophilus]|uniref:Methyltransferase n=1 Tax=Halolactibacillus halophilus TaxID=306540 RepID=A0A1I5SB86_9BACI|nr:16S rRNA (guanine(966)-N(2))-methyltransferase RsmD [Halolactibacillus halophilus]GEM02662.1 methyltransferase [Halolactibacillus halophilus]SFP67817.1 16S rRNA (guanine(966)-N(2))-methyltransferase RsmD [Halolactibacillus halophilus]